jgi:hypothetical protein
VRGGIVVELEQLDDNDDRHHCDDDRHHCGQAAPLHQETRGSSDDAHDSHGHDIRKRARACHDRRGAASDHDPLFRSGPNDALEPSPNDDQVDSSAHDHEVDSSAHDDHDLRKRLHPAGPQRR